MELIMSHNYSSRTFAITPKQIDELLQSYDNLQDLFELKGQEYLSRRKVTSTFVPEDVKNILYVEGDTRSGQFYRVLKELISTLNLDSLYHLTTYKYDKCFDVNTKAITPHSGNDSGDLLVSILDANRLTTMIGDLKTLLDWAKYNSDAIARFEYLGVEDDEDSIAEAVSNPIVTGYPSGDVNVWGEEGTSFHYIISYLATTLVIMERALELGYHVIHCTEYPT